MLKSANSPQTTTPFIPLHNLPVPRILDADHFCHYLYKMPSRNYATEEDIDKNESFILDDEDITVEALLSESDDSDYKYEEKMDVDDNGEDNTEENGEADDNDSEFQSDECPEEMSRRRLKLCELAEKWEADPKEPWQRGVCRCSKVCARYSCYSLHIRLEANTLTAM